MKSSEPFKTNLVLIGGRGSGKSALARRLHARENRFSLFQLDPLISAEAMGLTIPQIVEKSGWQGFRDLEYEVVRKVSSLRGGALLDTGGGVVVDLDDEGHEVFSSRKVDALREHGFVIYLQRDVDYLLGRIAGDSNRPSLSDVHSFEAIMERRDPWYRQAAHVVLECAGMSKKKLTKELLGLFLENEAAH